MHCPFISGRSLFVFVLITLTISLQAETIRPQHTDDLFHLLLSARPSQVENASRQTAAVIKWKNGDIHAVAVPKDNLALFLHFAQPEQVDTSIYPHFLFMDSARVHASIDSVLLGFPPLSQPYSAKQVVVGIIDASVDYRHPDFLNADSTTRFRFIWDQVSTGGQSPAPYGYGSQWSRNDINNNLCSHLPNLSDAGHGTCVTGAAAGNGFAVDSFSGTIPRYSSAAPDADIVFVHVKRDNQLISRIVDAVDYIFKKADALGKPCVINLSLGMYGGSHDGKELSVQLIENLLTERNGRALCTASGNAGHIPYHLGYTIPPDSAYTFFSYNAQIAKVNFEAWADSAQLIQAEFKIGCHDSLGGTLAKTDYLKIPVHFPVAIQSTQPVSVVRNLFNGASYLGQVTFTLTKSLGRFQLQCSILPSNTSHLWSLQSRGSGRLDIWSHPQLTGSSMMLTSLLDSFPILFPNYIKPDTMMTVAGYWACSGKVITVGNFTGRTSYLNRNMELVDLSAAPIGAISGNPVASSGKGPTRAGLLKPDLIAAGNYVICSGDQYYLNSLSVPADISRIADTRLHLLAEGSSISSALVSGVVAQYFEKRPQATAAEVSELLHRTAKKDAFTGPLTNNLTGYGKLDAFRALSYSGFIYGCTDSLSINFNPFADIDTGGCIPVITGCTDSSALNYNPLANTEDGSCVLLSVSERDTKWLIYPIPADNTLYITGETERIRRLSIRNMEGRLLLEKRDHIQHSFSVSSLSAGCYWLEIEDISGAINTQKLLITTP